MKVLVVVICLFLILGSVNARELRGGSSPLLVGDPKTVQDKQTGTDSRGKSLQLKYRYKDLKFLFFGTSRTWGPQLGEDEDRDRFTHAFPSLISPNAVNLGVRGAGPLYPKRCAFSMLKDYGDASFDVIVIEFWISGNAAIDLARRLRHRYPFALIIFLEMWTPQLYTHKPTGMILKTWSDQQGYKSVYRRSVDTNMALALKKLTKPEDWVYDNARSFSSNEQVERIQKEVGGIILRPPLPADVHQAVETFGNFFISDMSHYSKAGHLYVADQILQTLHDTNFRTEHDARGGPWQQMDTCESWFSTGTTPSMHIDPSLTMAEFKPGKFALEAPQNKTAWMRVTNPSQTQRVQLILQHMTTGPECKYKAAKLTVKTTGESIIAECGALPYPMQVHVEQQKHIAFLQPGVSTILTIETLPDELQAPREYPFRIVGIFMVPVDEY
jgi:hypothetical protein